MEPKAEENEEVFCMNDENEEEIEFVNNGFLIINKIKNRNTFYEKRRLE